MQDPKDFLYYRRTPATKQSATRRVRHWHEYEHVMSSAQVVCQSRRCMDCATPGCHSQCPVHNLIPDWNLLTADTDWTAAWAQLELTNNFPEFTGRLCPAPCEDGCTLSLQREPVTIRAIELALAEYAWRNGLIRPQPCKRPLALQVAVVGSGPAGLACAQQLARCGYRVTVYEKADRAGGLLRYGIPDFRLDRAALERRLSQLQDEGVSFRTGVRIGRDCSLAGLRAQADAVVLACGAEQPRALDIPGRHLAGVHYAMPYLTQQNRYVAGDSVGQRKRIDAVGLDVAVIGGGDTGGDCVGTAIRQGARSVTWIQYHERPPDHLDNLLYWPGLVPEWQHGDHDDEGCRHIWGYDTVAATGSSGRVSGLVLQRLRWMRDGDGRWKKHYLHAEPLHLPVQLVLVAAGFCHTLHDALLENAALLLDARGNVAASPQDYRTSVDGVFACGDMRRGASLIVWAIREGRQCARAVDIALRGDSELPYV